VRLCTRWLGAWLLLLAAMPFAHAADVCDTVRPLDRALRTVSQQGQVIEQSEVRAIDHLPRAWRGENTQIAYRVALGDCSARRNDQALWIYRIGAPYRVRIDGQPVVAIDPATRVDRLSAPVFNGRVPALYALPAGARELEIQLATLPYVSGGLVRLVTGPQEALLDQRVFETSVLSGFNDAASTIFGTVGLVALLVWVMRRRDRMVLWFGAACVFWAARGFAYQVYAYPLPALLMEQLNPWLVLATVACMMSSTLYSIGQVTRLRLVSIGTVLGLSTLGMGVTMLLGQGSLPMRALTFGAAFALVCGVMALTTWQWWRERQRALGVLALALLVLIGGAVHDLGMVVGAVTPDHWSFLTLTFSVLLICQTLVVSVYLGKTLNRAETTNQTLETAIAAKSRELEQSYARLRESERANVRTLERARLNREIHDGLGAQLITALRGVERGALSKEQVAQALQEGLDELRLLMDASDLGRSLHGALATWRNRWDVRLQAVGLDLHWSMDPALEDIELGSDATLQVMRVLQEAVTNAVKHSGGRCIHVLTRCERGATDALVLEIRDDGQGLVAQDIGTGAGRGLHNMAQRADRLRGDLVVENAPAGGVVVRLHLPLSAGGVLPSDAMPLGSV
jgi:signal transduction histidine kinase